MTALDNIPADILALAREALAAQFECSVKAFPSAPARARRGDMDHTYEIRAICRAIMADRFGRPVDTGREKALEEFLPNPFLFGVVEVRLRSGSIHTGNATHFQWLDRRDPKRNRADVVAYRVPPPRALANPENGRG